MRSSLLGTKHSSMLQGERSILKVIRKTEGIKKVKPLRIEWTGSNRQCFRLRSRVSARASNEIIEGWLFTGGLKRLYLIFPKPGVGLKSLGMTLSTALAQFRIEVEIATGGGGPKMELQDNRNAASTPSTPGIEDLLLTLSREEVFTWSELIFEKVKKVKELEEYELELELQLEEIRKQKAQLQNEEIEVFAKALVACQQMAKCKVS